MDNTQDYGSSINNSVKGIHFKLKYFVKFEFK